ncbi:hypothetical protein [Rhodonellum sp.]|uniref:hypothetical protein n=1 Tax=Rhodonellum sp. TaxID=2231180 RepID=UPI00272878E4|nr:hypothetical protein [Rhodonellum sp.]MDO9553307.1 hypothetical protein [Rhodonellum sp.]
MTDIIKDLFQSVNERVRNRVFGSFLISLIFWNWKPILLILSSNRSIEYTIDLIDDSEYFNFWNILVIPIGISISYSLVIPFLSLMIAMLIKWPETRSIIAASEIKEAQKKEEAKIAHWDHKIEIAKAGEMTISDLNDRIEYLDKSNKEYIEQNEKLRGIFKSVESKNINLTAQMDHIRSIYSKYTLDLITSRYSDQEQIHILNALSSLQNKDTYLHDIKNEVKNDLVQFKMVDRNKNLGNNKEEYFLTDFGKMFISHVLNSQKNVK